MVLIDIKYISNVLLFYCKERKLTMNFIGIQSLVSIASHIFFILLTFWSLQAVRIENLIRKQHVRQARVLYLLISIAIGYTVSSFFIEFILTSQNLVFLF